MTEPTTATSRLRTTDRMSGTPYRRAGQPTWWARIDHDDADAEWVEIGDVAGNRTIDRIVDVEPGTTVHCGVSRGKGAIRETVITVDVGDVETEPDPDLVAVGARVTVIGAPTRLLGTVTESLPASAAVDWDDDTSSTADPATLAWV